MILPVKAVLATLDLTAFELFEYKFIYIYFLIYSHHIAHNFFKTCKVALKVKSYFLAYLLYSYCKHVLHCAVQLYTLIL